MMSGSALRITLIAGAILLTAVVYLLPKGPEKTGSKTEQKPVTAQSFSISKYESEAKSKLEWNASNRITIWSELLNKNENKLDLYDSVAGVWDQQNNPGIAAGWFEKKAKITQNEKDWLNAAYRYFDAYKAGKDSSEVAYFTGMAIQCYSRVMEINPSNLDAKMDLGVLYAEGTGEPMKGIMMLREVVTENPFHENAQLNLGFLSMKSGQLDKARERFRKVLEINPARIDMYVYIGESLVREGNIKEAINNFEIFKNLTNDPAMISDIDEYIIKLKQQLSNTPAAQ
jgi:tetratricopeptide (TPR) repeat protein